MTQVVADLGWVDWNCGWEDENLTELAGQLDKIVEQIKVTSTQVRDH